MNFIKISKTTLLAAAIIGAPAVFANSSVNSSETNTTYETSTSSTQMERTPAPGSETGIDQQGMNNPSQDDAQMSSTESAADQQQSAALAGRHVQMLEFDADSVMLSDSAQQQLDALAGSLDKDTPAKITVQMERQSVQPGTSEQSSVGDTTGQTGTSEALAGRADAGQALGSETTRDEDSAAQLSQEMQENERLISEHRAERVKQFLEDRGVEVSEVTVERDGQGQGLTSGESTPQEDMGGEQATDENVQEVLIVISERQAREGISVR